MKAGDEIVSINQLPAAGESVYALERVLDGVAGEEAQVEVKRGTTQRLHFLRTSTFKSAATSFPCLTGLVARLIFGKSMEVFSLKQRSPLFVAGVRTGDEITVIDGKSVAGQKMEAVIELMRAQQMTLTVRGKKGKERTVVVRVPVVPGKR